MDKLVKTTIRLKQGLKKQAQSSAKKQKMSLQSLINQALLFYLNKHRKKDKLSGQKLSLKSFNVGVGKLPSRKRLYKDLI